MKKIGVITTSRADYGLYLPVLKRVQESRSLKLQLFVTGAHLLKQYGHSIGLIREDKFPIAAQVKVRQGDNAVDIARSMGKVTAGFADIFARHKPDIVLVLGDRFEMHAAAVAAIPFGIPLAHIHGGELTFGAIDEYFRHSLTKLSDIHFVSTESYAQRVRQMGEEPASVHVVGAPGLDNFLHMKPQPAKDMRRLYQLDVDRPILLTTFHPVTKEAAQTRSHIGNLLKALKIFKEHFIVFTAPNADIHSAVIIEEIIKFIKSNPNSTMVDNFGPQGYLSMMHYARAMVCNSSSGIIEAASFRLPVVNIGNRQQGRIRPANVIDTDYGTQAIEGSIRKAVSEEFKRSLNGLKNPYGDGKASERIVSFLEKVDLTRPMAKRFVDWKEEMAWTS